MPAYRYLLVNVFSEAPLSGLPIAVFDQPALLDEASMQGLAQQIQTSVSVFLMPSARAHVRLAIFSPERPLRFSAAALLAAATVLREQTGQTLFSIETPTLIAPLWVEQERWFYQVRSPGVRACEVRKRHLAAMLSLQESDIDEPALFIHGGIEQLVIPLTQAEAVRHCQPKLEDLSLHAVNEQGRPHLLVWYRSVDVVQARSFGVRFGALREEPASGAAIAALGGYLLHTRAPLPVSLRIRQGDHLERPARLALQIDDNQRILLGGQTRIQASGELHW